MSITATYPGVYIEEVPSGVRTIAGVGTAVTAFVGYSRRGPIDEPVKVFGFGDYERTFGALDPDSNLGYAVYHYFLNGGTEAIVVRVAPGAATASVQLNNEDGTHVLTASAKELGAAGNNLRIEVDYDSRQNPDSFFNLRVLEYGSDESGAPKVLRSEAYSELTMNRRSGRYAVTFVNERSQLVTLTRASSAPAGTHGRSVSADIGGFTPPSLVDATHSRLKVAINGMEPFEIDLLPADAATFGDIADRIQARIRARDLGNPVLQSVFAMLDPDAVAPVVRLVIESRLGDDARSVQVLEGGTNDVSARLLLGGRNGGTEPDAVAAVRPALTGTRGGANTTTVAAGGTARRVGVRVVRGAVTPPAFTTLTLLSVSSGTLPATAPSQLVDALNTQLRAQADPVLRGASARLLGKRLQVTSRTSELDASIEFADASDPTTFAALGLNPAFTSNVVNDALGVPTGLLRRGVGVAGSDGAVPSALQLLGNQGLKTGLYALKKADYFSLACVPFGFSSREDAETVYQGARAFCEERRAMLFVDVPHGLSETDREEFISNMRHKNTVTYHPRVRAPDPAQNNLVRAFAPSGAVAGVYARTDAERGLWKAPAGMDAAVRGAQALEVSLSEGDIGDLNREGINCLRATPLNGTVVWGARTLVGNDDAASEWKYVPVRRLALYLEESLYRGTQWVVFEPNDEPLWSQIRLNVGAFMQSLFRQGAFQGRTPKEAYLVKCDRETTTQDDANRGIVNVLVGFAPLKPAEFVFLKIQQLAGQSGA